jgi:hypothetical protein
MRRVNLFLIAVVTMLLLPLLAFGQLKETAAPQHFSKLLTTDPQPSRGLAGWLGLNPARFSMSQSYSLSYLSFGGRGFSQGVYLNTMQYQLANPLSMSVQWGMAHQPFASAGLPGIYGNGLFFSGANLEYKPSEKFRIGLSIDSYPPGTLSPNAYDFNRYDGK